MKVYNENVVTLKNKDLINELKIERNKRNFNPETYLNLKFEKIKCYFDEHKLDSIVIAVSGGVDSALVLALMVEFQKRYPEVLKKILPITLPAVENTGVSGQEELKGRVLDLSKSINIPIEIYDLSQISQQVNKETEDKFKIEIGDWAKGQFVPYLRTSYLYYLTNILSQEGYRSILIGTTNADEGQYLGYIGKASDGMVDLQPISDLHKREVLILAKVLNVPDSIIQVDPKGDMYDERTDEEVFGTSYDCVELYYKYLKKTQKEKEVWLTALNDEAREEFNKISINLENMHQYNLHKYLGCSPAVHLDVFPMQIKGGWKYYNFQ